ncbi:hypothetical protein KA012_02690, partial [Candidatus Woesebacteria bacterium]|nr:hypothetical protein [Candidatus Woesebacteria bacterium]
MKIYFGASITNDRTLLPVYQHIVAELKKQGHTIVSEYVVDPSLVPGDGLSPEELFKRETHTVEEADVMVAEVTVPSWGTAFLMEHALKNDIPVLALFYQETQHKLPMMIEGNRNYFLEHYSESNLATVLKRNLKHFKQLQQDRGKFIVIDGADGSGKATQTEMLLEYLQKKKIKSEFIAFPRYYTSFHGHHVGRFLKGEFGGNQAVSPYLSSLAYALDRLTAKEEMDSWLLTGSLVVADRFVSSSMAHQASKLPPAERDEFIDWIYNMEYKEHKLPQEDIVLFLYVPVEVSQQLLEKKASNKFVKGKDIAEKDLEHQRQSIEMYRALAKRFKHWRLIECVNEKNELLSKEDIHK